MNDEFSHWSAREIAERVRARDVSASEVVAACLATVERVEPTIHAFSYLAADEAIAEAKKIDGLLAGGVEVGPLAGVPVGVKDTLFVAGLPTTLGSPLFEDMVADSDETTVASLRRAGAVVLGKTNIPELAFSSVGHNPIFPTTTNPWNPELTPGGSSSGSAAGVAVGECPIALGADRAGSIRIPAAHCGVVGLKPTKGLVPDNGWGDALTTVGPIARDVADAAVLLDVLTAFDPADPDSIPMTLPPPALDPSRALRVAFSLDFGFAPVDPEVRTVVTTAVELMASVLGWEVDQLDEPWPDLWNEFITLASVGMDLVELRRRLPEVGHRMTPHVVAALQYELTGAQVASAYRARRDMCARVASVFETYDLIVTPTVAVPPFALHTQGLEKIDGVVVDPLQWIPFTFPFNFSGNPAVSMPAGFTTGGLPVGLQLVAQRFRDRDLLAAAAVFEGISPAAGRRPPLATFQPGDGHIA
jgi:aspartyl-tRNA(Asn)/glutamyl-tRNA(Gln) amidotransferase subunit A